MKTILITGATSGIGKACAEHFAAIGHRLILTGRRNERLKELKDTLSERYGIDCLCLNFDVRKRSEVEQQLGGIAADWQNIDILINNAGLAMGMDPIQSGLVEDWEQMIDTNVKGLLYVSREIIRYMMKNGSGHIINIGSIAGRQTYPKGNVYCATKAAVSSLTEAMRIDLNGTNIKVGQIQPGAVNTEFSTVRFHGDKERANKVYEGFDELTAKDIADAIVFMAEAPAHVNIAELLILPTAQASASIFDRKV